VLGKEEVERNRGGVRGGGGEGEGTRPRCGRILALSLVNSELPPSDGSSRE